MRKTGETEKMRWSSGVGLGISLSEDRNRKVFGGHSCGLVLTELAVILAAAAFCALIFLPVLSGEVEAERRAECLNNLRKVGQAMSAYAADYDGYYPHAWRGTQTVQLIYRFSDYWGASPASLLLIEGYAGESGAVFRCPSFVPEPGVAWQKNIPIYRAWGQWTWEGSQHALSPRSTWRNCYGIHAGYIHHEGGAPEIITDWEYESPGANPSPHYRVAVRDTAPGRKVLAGDKARGTWGATDAPSRGWHTDSEGILAGANFVYSDGGASWHPFTGYNFENFSHYSMPRNSGHTAGWSRTSFYYLPVGISAE